MLSTIELSQGQRKRLALLTAYLEDRPIYLFDEWAADQDPLFKEVFYLQLLPELKARGKTVLVISHDDHYYSRRRPHRQAGLRHSRIRYRLEQSVIGGCHLVFHHDNTRLALKPAHGRRGANPQLFSHHPYHLRRAS